MGKKVPENRKEYVEAFAGLLKKSEGYVFGRTKGWPENWFYECYSDVKYEREREDKIKRLMWWFKKTKPV